MNICFNENLGNFAKFDEEINSKILEKPVHTRGRPRKIISNIRKDETILNSKTVCTAGTKLLTMEPNSSISKSIYNRDYEYGDNKFEPAEGETGR